jgi:hypothetical protein
MQPAGRQGRQAPTYLPTCDGQQADAHEGRPPRTCTLACIICWLPGQAGRPPVPAPPPASSARCQDRQPALHQLLQAPLQPAGGFQAPLRLEVAVRCSDIPCAAAHATDAQQPVRLAGGAVARQPSCLWLRAGMATAAFTGGHPSTKLQAVPQTDMRQFNCVMVGCEVLGGRPPQSAASSHYTAACVQHSLVSFILPMCVDGQARRQF